MRWNLKAPGSLPPPPPPDIVLGPGDKRSTNERPGTFPAKHDSPKASRPRGDKEHGVTNGTVSTARDRGTLPYLGH